MNIFSTYSVKIKHYNHIFKDTISIYREAVDFLIEVCLKEWEDISAITGNLLKQQCIERLCHWTADNPDVRYSEFDKRFYKFPSYLRRGAINEAIGKVTSYKSSLANWSSSDAHIRGRKPSYPKAGYVYPCMYKTVMYEQTVIAVDLGINSTATISVMRSDGTVLGRHFCRLPKEYDSLTHSINRIKKAQQHGNHKTPRLWAKAKGLNKDISVKTAGFIMDMAVLYNADVIVFEHLDLASKKRGSKKQKLHMWRSRYVQSMVENKAHRLGMRISHVCAWGTSRLAYDGSGPVQRGKEAGLGSYSICRFQNGKVYNCDLNASYNIGSRYFVREILKSLPARERLAIEAKDPHAARRSTCTLSTLINLNAEHMILAA